MIRKTWDPEIADIYWRLTLGQTLFWVLLCVFIYLIFRAIYEVGAVDISILQMRKLKHELWDNLLKAT